MGDQRNEGRKCITELPQECMCHILKLTSPRDAARSTVLSTEFRSAANSDVVWESFLPPDYEEMLSNLEIPPVFSSKKDLYFHLCKGPLPLRDNNKSYWLEKATGKKCYRLVGRQLLIELENVTSYWRPMPNFSFGSVATLMIDCTLKVTGKIKSKMLSPSTTYLGYLLFKVDSPEELCARWGWNIGGFGGNFGRIRGQGHVRGRGRGRGRGYMHAPGQGQGPGLDVEEVPHMRADGWSELEMGTLFNGNDRDELDMEMRGFHLHTPNSGLLLKGVELRPSPNAPRMNLP